METDEKKTPTTAWAVLEMSDTQPLLTLWRLQAIDYLLTHLNPDLEPDAAHLGMIHEMVQEMHLTLNQGLSELQDVAVAA